MSNKKLKSIDKLIKSFQQMEDKKNQKQKKKEQQLWKKIDIQCDLYDALSVQKKKQLDNIRKSYGLKGLSSLNKKDLAVELKKLIPIHFKEALYTIDEERYQLIKEVCSNSGHLVISNDIPMSKVEALIESSLVFPSMINGKKTLVMPSELIKAFAETDGNELQHKVSRNTEWIKLTHGLLYYYGYLNKEDLLVKINSLTETEIDVNEFINVITIASNYYKQLKTFQNGLGDYRVYDVKSLIDDQKSRDQIDFYPFSKCQLLEAGNTDFINRTPELNELINFLLEDYELTKKEIAELSSQITVMINIGANIPIMIDVLQSQFQFSSEAFAELLTAKMVKVYNNTRKWDLKGYTPKELSDYGTKITNTSLLDNENENKVSTITRTKISRNAPCPCGSGKKYKKCCG
jgi:hypothetical protein